MRPASGACWSSLLAATAACGSAISSLAAGAVLEAPTTVSAWGKLALFADPFGHGFCLVQFLGRGYAFCMAASRFRKAAAPG